MSLGSDTSMEAIVSTTRRVRASLGPAALANRAALETRHREIFAGSPANRIVTAGVVALVVGLLVGSFAVLDFSVGRIGTGLAQLAHFVTLMVPPSSGTWSRFLLFLGGLGETLAIALLGTLFAAILAFPFGFLAARNVVPVRLFQFATRRFLDTIRGVDTLIWALIWINVVGLGPFAGVLAIMTSDFGSFGKLFSEAIEAVDAAPQDGVVAAGGTTAARLRFGILPQVLPVIAGQVLYFFESNTRSATIIGIVGAGGIGLHLAEAIRTLEWQQVSLLVLMVLVTVSIIDQISARIRFAIIGERRLET
jgi:phosphonate transport system permease protein